MKNSSWAFNTSTCSGDKKQRIRNLLLSALMTLSIGPCCAQSAHIASLAGEWQFTASNNGKEVVPGIYSAGKDTIRFKAVVDEDDTSLNCHADCMYRSTTGNEYPANWKIIVEENSSGLYRLGWQLTLQQPAFTKEFPEPRESYLEKGIWYWGEGVTASHHYIYLLTENEDATAHVGTTFWSPWSKAGTQEYELTSTEYNSKKFYAIVAADIPYANSIGYIEIWASPKIKQINGSAINDIKRIETKSQSVIYDLTGRPVKTQPQHGLYIRDGKKWLQHDF